MGAILYQIFKIIREHYQETRDADRQPINSNIQIYINRTDNRITIKIKTGYYLDLSMPETMRILGSIELHESTWNHETTWFIEKNCVSLELEDRITLILVNNWYQDKKG